MGCENMPNDFIPGTFDASVHLIFSTEKKSHRLYFNSIIGLNDSLMKYQAGTILINATFIRNAKVTVNDYLFNEVVMKPETLYINNNYYPVINDYYYELKKPGFIKLGNEYNLSIITDKGIITGRTRVPRLFKFTSHPKESVIKYTGETVKVKVAWERSPDASGYIYNVLYPMESYAEDDTIYYYRDSSTPLITHDTCFTFNIYSFQLKSGNNEFTIEVRAFDENYDNYYNKAQKSSGLNGAYGVFGSMVLDTIMINVKKE
jgi:hypothetical protein